jgi:hypothetical protein
MFRPLYFYLLALVMAFGVSAHAQFAKSPYVKRDPRVDKLVDKQIELNKQALRVRTTLEPGFRILVISTNKRDLAIDAKSRLLKKVQFGNFRTMKEAEQLKKELAPDFGEDLIIIPSQVEVKGEKQEAENF